MTHYDLHLLIYPYCYFTKLVQISTMNRAINYQQNTVNADLKLINQFAKPSFEERLVAPKNLNELGTLLKNKNVNIKKTKEEKQKAQDWIQKKGVDLHPLFEKVKSVKEMNHRNQMQKKVEEDSYFHFKQITTENQHEYLDKAFEYSVFNLFQHISSSRSVSKTFTAKIMSKLTNNPTGFIGSREVNQIRTITSHVRSGQKKELYISAMRSLIDKQENLKDELIKQLKDCINNPVWEIMEKQIKDIKEDEIMDENAVIQVLLNSLKIVEEEFHHQLPTSSDSIAYYLNHSYLNQITSHSGSFFRDNDSGAFWGKCFLLYRAGRKAQFYQMLAKNQYTQLMALFYQADASIKNKYPIKPNKFYQTKFKGKDIFYDQLMYALYGESKYSSDVICNPKSLDMAWILLRNTGIFYENSGKKFKEYVSLMIETYKNPEITLNQLKNMFYLLAYDQVVELGPNELLDADDYLHFLLVLAHNSIFYHKSSKEMIEKKLIQCLRTYIYELMAQKRSEYIYYMCLIPENSLISEISNIVTSSQLLKDINWDFLKKHLRIGLFQNLIRETLKRYVLQHQDYIAAAEKSLEILKDSQTALEFLLRYLVQTVLSKKNFASSDLDQAQKIVQKVLYEDENLSTNYGQVFKLLIENRKLGNLIMQRNESKIQNFIKSCTLIIQDGRVNYTNTKMFEKLIQNNGFEVYFVFLRNIIKGSQISLSRKGSLVSLGELYRMIYTSMRQILKMEDYYNFGSEPIIVEVMEYLNSQVQDQSYL